jgi:hypothetical protein
LVCSPPTEESERKRTDIYVAAEEEQSAEALAATQILLERDFIAVAARCELFQIATKLPAWEGA